MDCLSSGFVDVWARNFSRVEPLDDDRTANRKVMYTKNVVGVLL